jgi:hypothetical protein
LWAAVSPARAAPSAAQAAGQEAGGTAGAPGEEVAEAEEDEAEAEQPEGAAAETETASEAEEEAEGEEAEQPEEAPEGVRRSRPRTAEEERAYKQRKTREDPFLNPPVAPGTDGSWELYDPRDWLRMDVTPDLSRYIVQDASGAVVGYLSVFVELQSDPALGQFINLVKVRDYGSPTRIELWIYADTLKPRRKLATPVDRPAGGAQQPGQGEAVEVATAASEEVRLAEQTTLEVDYLFDRVTVKRQMGEVTASRQLRQPPYSFDVDQLSLLVRQLDSQHLDWPFEAVAFDPSQAFEQSGASLPLAVAKPERVEMISAEPATYPCFALRMRLGEKVYTWWVERLAPHRLVKFTDGVYSFTLFQYIQQ